MELHLGRPRLPATLDLPAGPARGGLAVLHGSHADQRSYFLYEHLARLLPPAGIAVLRYDRRPRVDGRDVPLTEQADDAAAALDELRRRVGDVPVGLWGFSQGTWAAALTASRHPVDFLVLVGSSGVSPAAQMRYGTAEQLRRHGYGPADLAELARLRGVAEAYLRGAVPRAVARAELDAAVARPWFPLAFLPRELPEPGSWADLDFDPEPVFAKVSCPVLLCYGETDAWTPIEESLAVWRRSGADLTVARLAGCDHAPTRHEGDTVDSVSPQYERTLLDWLDRRLGAAG
ncbi:MULTISPECIES: alpha/beta fold hydrolase [Micromonospora]|uniref:Alpha/beta hydrolase n=1 Tax=Micromonospora solifontis TaxID=2487138 RepID=A0ABX9WG69_9ACTN|nr:MULTISPECIES: alpha/beta hydrolase [Micromonospora]NES13570.1 alpha/beta hydrolase [Micromonospora sp. PPF5-17B]NES37272.1 alpha/beta hydrolase [Micromonospora solifontis]NES55464.1 alpha/beta hydrolase [Micromonospora sp. PPF5-6]RNL98505.1 alpha/beta hydrolase [Micromonospora solifontis]